MFDPNKEPEVISGVCACLPSTTDAITELLEAATSLLRRSGQSVLGRGEAAAPSIQVDDVDYHEDAMSKDDALQLYADLGMVSLQQPHLRALFAMAAAQGVLTAAEIPNHGGHDYDFGNALLARIPIIVSEWVEATNSHAVSRRHPLTKMYRDMCEWLSNVATREDGITQEDDDDEKKDEEPADNANDSVDAHVAFFARVVTKHLRVNACDFEYAAAQVYFRRWPGESAKAIEE